MAQAPPSGGNDHIWLYNAPACYNACQWSEDNHVAVATANTVTILNPGHLDGPRAVAATPGVLAKENLRVDGVPADAERSAQLVWAVVGEVKSSEPNTKVPVRSVAWSPAGCTPTGGCLLATVTTDSKVG
jgi:hypothetical protein